MPLSQLLGRQCASLRRHAALTACRWCVQVAGRGSLLRLWPGSVCWPTHTGAPAAAGLQCLCKPCSCRVHFVAWSDWHPLLIAFILASQAARGRAGWRRGGRTALPDGAPHARSAARSGWAGGSLPDCGGGRELLQSCVPAFACIIVALSTSCAGRWQRAWRSDRRHDGSWHARRGRHPVVPPASHGPARRGGFRQRGRRHRQPHAPNRRHAAEAWGPRPRPGYAPPVPCQHAHEGHGAPHHATDVYSV